MARTTKVINNFIDLANKLNAQKAVVEPELEIEKARLQSSFYEFVKAAWPYCGSTQAFRDNWHIQVICEHMEEFFYGGITYFLLNIPIRMGKSSLICVLFPAWVWINNPKAQFLFGSYALEFARRDSSYCNELISSEWYKKRWGSTVKLTRKVNNIDKFRFTAGGSRQIISVGSSVTGMNADYIIIDDANNVSESESLVTQNATNRWWSQAASLRFNDLRNMRKMVVQQRCFVADTKITLANKEQANIQDVRVGDMVLSYNHETQQNEERPVLKTFKGTTDELVELELENGTVIECTPEHPIYTVNRGYVEAKDLLCSDALLSVAPIKIKHMKTKVTDVNVYNIEVLFNNNYYAQDILVHNCNENDLSGSILSTDKENLTHLFLPMEYEPFRHCVTVPIKSTRSYRITLEDGTTREYHADDFLNVHKKGKLKIDQVEEGDLIAC